MLSKAAEKQKSLGQLEHLCFRLFVSVFETIASVTGSQWMRKIFFAMWQWMCWLAGGPADAQRWGDCGRLHEDLGCRATGGWLQAGGHRPYPLLLVHWPGGQLSVIRALDWHWVVKLCTTAFCDFYFTTPSVRVGNGKKRKKTPGVYYYDKRFWILVLYVIKTKRLYEWICVLFVFFAVASAQFLFLIIVKIVCTCVYVCVSVCGQCVCVCTCALWLWMS